MILFYNYVKISIVKNNFKNKVFFRKGVIKLRVHKKNALLMPEKLNSVFLSDDQTDYKIIYENIKNYVVFKISIITNLKDRLAYLDVLDHMERIQLESKKIRGG